MATGTVSVPGVGNSTFQLSYSTEANQSLAQALSNALLSLRASGQLNPVNYDGANTPPANQQLLNELVTQPGQGLIQVPPGYVYTADDTGGGGYSAIGVINFLGGDGNLYIQNAQIPSGTEQIAAGDGNDFLQLVAGTNYQVALGNGNDTVLAGGAGTIRLGSGNDSITLSTGSDTIFAGAGSDDTVTGNGGSVVFVGGSGGIASVMGGAGSNVVIGSSDGVTFYSSPSIGGGAAGGALLVAGAGNEFLFAAGSFGHDQLWSSFTGGNDVLLAGHNSSILVAGNGNDTLVGSASHQDAFYFLNGAAGGHDFLSNVGASSIVSLTGYDSLYGGAAGSGAAGAQVAAQLAFAVNASGGSGTVSVTLKDNTTITFENLTSAGAIPKFTSS